MENIIQVEAARLGITVTFSHEKEPLGTAGPLALSRHILAKELAILFKKELFVNFNIK